MRLPIAFLAASVLLSATASTDAGQPGSGTAPAGVRALREASGGTAEVRLHPATGSARLIRLSPGRPLLEGQDPAARGADFLRRFGSAFGIARPEAELTAAGGWRDHLGHTHLRFRQTYRGLPVFGAEIRLHFDASGNLLTAQGTFIPDLALDPSPRRTPEEAAATAIAEVRREVEGASSAALEAKHARLLVFREGLLQRVPGPDRLAWEIEVGDGARIREFVYLDAHTGKRLERITGIQPAIHRTLHSPELFNIVIWDEGSPLPYASGDPAGDAQVNGLIEDSLDVYDVFRNLSGGSFLSWDGSDAVMHNVWNVSAPGFCPNAAWDGTAANFCYGVTGDDTAVHEWTHAYTERTHGLIYAWQSGALNEAFSDIFGEMIDLLNGAGTDTPGGPRTAAACSTLGGRRQPTVTFNSPAALAGTIVAAGATFGPAGPLSATANVAMANDGVGVGTDACEALVAFPAGRIALLDRGTCTFAVKVKNAQNAGAAGAIVVNTTATTAFTMTGTDATITIPSVMVGSFDGDRIKAQLGAGVSATLALAPASDATLRWLHGEDDPSFGGPIRDMWNPTCFSDPAKVGDRSFYVCTTSDSGGVHTNSGIPNHAFALLVDGGTYNGQTIAALGSTKAAHLYWRAMSVYQGPDSGFADHADALELSCSDLIGVSLADPVTGAPSGQAFGAADCQEVAKAMLAVEMRTAPAFCAFRPLLDPNTPPLAAGLESFSETFETDPAGRWARSNAGVYAEWRPRDWEWDAAPPAGGAGRAMFAIDSLTLGNCAPGSDDQSGVLILDSPTILLRSDFPVLTFDHYVATEAGWDGGNVQVSINGGGFGTFAAGDFRFNPYNTTLQAAPANTNPLQAQPAFSGANGGENQGSWGQSQIDLTAIAGVGETVQLRFQFGTDGCNGLDGWYVDNVRIVGDCSLGGDDTDADAFRICDGDCNDGDPATRPGAPETNDGADNQCPGEAGYGLTDEISGTVGFLTPGDATRLSWPAQTGASQYQVARAASRDFAAGCTTFLTGNAFLADAATPASRGALYYLVRPSAPNAGSWGARSSGAARAVPCAP